MRCRGASRAVRAAVLGVVAGATLAPAAGAATGNLELIGGTGVGANSPDGLLREITLNGPSSTVVRADGSLVFAESNSTVVRRVRPDGRTVTLAGQLGAPGSTGDGGPAVDAKLTTPYGLTELADGSILIAEFAASRVRRIAPDGTISIAAGTGAAGFSGDGGPASAAQLRFPTDVSATPDGGYLIADYLNHRIRKVSASGTISTVAGTGVEGASPDGTIATSAQLAYPLGVAALPSGGFLIAEYGTGTPNVAMVRRVLPTGTIQRVAGGGAALGDGGLATAAQLKSPHGLQPMADGGFLVTDQNDHRVRRVSGGGVITTIAGTGSAGSLGLSGPATLAQVNIPFDVSLMPDGDVLIAQFGGNILTSIDLGDPPPPTPTPTPAPTPTSTPAPTPQPTPKRPPSLFVNPVLSWDRLRSGKTRLRTLSIESTIAGDTLLLTCTGKGCPKKLKRLKKTVKKTPKRGRYSLTSAVGRTTLSAGAKLTIRASRPGFADRIVTYTMVRRANPSKLIRCQAPGDAKPVTC